jgi:hypothetical protein
MDTAPTLSAALCVLVTKGSAWTRQVSCVWTSTSVRRIRGFVKWDSVSTNQENTTVSVLKGTCPCLEGVSGFCVLQKPALQHDSSRRVCGHAEGLVLSELQQVEVFDSHDSEPDPQSVLLFDGTSVGPALRTLSPARH